jgi:predicted TIM-barrel fold metal-dependent hydrolase
VIVDLHANLYHPTWYPKAFQESVINEFVRRQEAAGRSISRRRAQTTLDSLLPDRDGSRTLRLMDEVGIDKKAIMIMDWGLALGEAEKSIGKINEEILRVCSGSPDRLAGFVGVDPRRPEARDIVRRALDNYGAQGLKLHPTTGWRLDDDSALEIVELAVERSVPILVHIGTTIEELSDVNARPCDIVALAKRFPHGTFIAGHAGFERWTEFAQVEIPWNLHCDISGWQALVGSDLSQLEHHLFGLMAVFPNRVHFGTDGPFYSYNLPASEQRWLQLVSKCLISAPPRLQGGLENVLDSSALLARSV